MSDNEPILYWSDYGEDDFIDEEVMGNVDSDSDNELIWYSSDEEDEATTVLAKFEKDHEYKGGKLKVGDVFLDVTHFRTVLTDHMVSRGFDIVRKYSEPRRFSVNCKENGCSWNIYAARINNESGFVIKKLCDTHNCRLTKESLHVTFPWTAEKIKNLVAHDRNVKVKTLIQYMHEKYSLTVPEACMHRARRRARDIVFGIHKKGYEKLFQYAEALLKADPKTLCKVMSDNYSYVDKVLFHRFFVSFPAQRNAYLNGCRPFFGVDGCHLKGTYGGVMLAAVGIDGNNSMVPLAICVCEKENTETWAWFLQLLRDHIDDGRQVTISSDRQKGCVAAMNSVWPKAIHRPCCRHIYANFAKVHTGLKLWMLFWKAAKSNNKADYDLAMQEIQNAKPEAYKWLTDLANEYKWSMCTYDKHCKVEKTDNNASETFNSWILPHRDKPCMTMLDEIRRQLMKMWTDRSKEVTLWCDATNIPLRIRKKLEWKKKEGMKMIVQPSGELNFEVVDKSYITPRRFVVKLGLRFCDCGLWEISGLPCTHAMACLHHARHSIEDYVQPCYSKQACMTTYSVMLEPLSDECTWDPCTRPLLHPPNIRSKIGRPKKSKKRSKDEPKKLTKRFLYKCKTCGYPNHNSRTCPQRKGKQIVGASTEQIYEATGHLQLQSHEQQSKQKGESTSIGKGKKKLTANFNKKGKFRQSQLVPTQTSQCSSAPLLTQTSNVD